MESKIRIDLNEKNEAVIIVEWRNSDDLRDKVVKQFIDAFGYESNEANVTFKFEKDIMSISAMIKPVPSKNTNSPLPDIK